MLNRSFVPVAIDINFVKHRRDAEGDFFRHIAEQGHYAGRTKPTATRQGLYIVGTDGDLLHSLNSTRAENIIKLMNRGLEQWNQKQNGNAAAKPFRKSLDADQRFVRDFPTGGLILRQTMRDLPRRDTPDHKTDRHNFDHVWLTAKERSEFVPREKRVGQSWSISESTIKRIVAFHTVDQVRGEADCWTLDEVKQAQLSAKVSDVSAGKITIQLSGTARCHKAASGEVNPFNKRAVTQDLSNDLTIRGWIVYDSKSQQFDSFRMLAAGTRTGAATYNFRWDDEGPAPIGFAFEMLDDKPENRVKPKFIHWQYFGNAER